jgi:small subunit ribosomal protein S20
VLELPNIKSAIKRVRVIEKKTEANKAVKSALKTQIKKFDAAIEAGESNLNEEYIATVKKVDIATSKGIIHKNKANRTKSQLAKRLNSASAK